jgi:hypothetical protein
MNFIKKNIFGILSIIISVFLLINYTFYFQYLKDRLNEYGKNLEVENGMRATLIAGNIKIVIVHSIFIVLPLLLLIIHFVIKKNRKISLIALMLILAYLFFSTYSINFIYDSIKV